MSGAPQVAAAREPAARPAGVAAELRARFGPAILAEQTTADGIPTLWVSPHRVKPVLRSLQREVEQPYRVLYDITAIDERVRADRHEQPESEFTVVYQLLSYERNADVRLKVPLGGDAPSLPTVTDLWPAANWYEREVWDMFGVAFEGHPHLARILMPPWWRGHPLRKDHPSRGTEMGPYQLPDEKQEREQAALQFRPEDWGMRRSGETTDFMFLNLGPQHPGTHGVLRLVLQLDGEEVVDCVPDIGYHHRAAEKVAERQTWHSYIPYTDRVDYLSGFVNELAYLTSVERLAGIDVPERATVMRIMLSELFRIANHLVWYGTYAQDVGALSPVFYMFSDRERIFQIIEAVSGYRMHPGWFRIGGTAADLPDGWEAMVRDFIAYFPRRLEEYDDLVLRNRIFKARTVGIGEYTLEEAIDWGVTGPNLRACGMAWDLRKTRPYAGYEGFDFDVPTARRGDCYDRAVVRVEEMRQSLRIVEQCVQRMPPGAWKADHPLATPPPKERTLHDIETLIQHFLNVSWGPVLPRGECGLATEASKGMTTYYCISDGHTNPYRVHIRTPSFAHMQTVPLISRGLMVSDVLAILGSLDFVMADVDR
jgi:NADH-quinone oxidoreductase subunit C/D